MGEEPKLARRRANRHSTIKSGRTIGERREKLETSNERMAARKAQKRKKNLRVFFVSVLFLVAAAVLIIISGIFSKNREELTEIEVENYEPTIEIVDEASTNKAEIPARMKNYIGQAEADFKALGYKPVKAVLPVGSVREIDFYLEGYDGFIKTTVDRETAVSVEDADRMIRYLKGKDITKFEYIDVRVVGKAFWK